MKTIRNKFGEICSFHRLLEAHVKARKGKGSKNEIILFELELNFNIMQIKTELENKSYKISGYNHFKVYEPKEREIMSLSYRDRVVQHCLCDNVIEPYFDKRLDYDNAACRKGKGTHFALNRLKRFLHEAYNKWGCDYYILKCDIRKYFYNINHDILKNILYSHIEDEGIKWLLDVIIDSTPGKTGLPIGNMTSQWFAVIYLDIMDRFIRTELKIPYYTRYMDDFVLIHKDKLYLKECRRRLEKFLANELELELNEKTQIFPVKNGIDYLGFHSYLTETGRVIRKIRRNSKSKMNKKIKKFNKLYHENKITYEEIRQSTAAWIGHAKHGNTYNLRKNIIGKLKLIKGDGEIEKNNKKDN